MTIKRTFSLDPEVDEFISGYANKSKAINEIIKKYKAMLEEKAMIDTYQAMGLQSEMQEFQEWKTITLADGL